MTTNERVFPTRLQAHPSTYSSIVNRQTNRPPAHSGPRLLICLPQIPWAAEPHIGPADHTGAPRFAHAWFTGPTRGPVAPFDLGKAAARPLNPTLGQRTTQVHGELHMRGSPAQSGVRWPSGCWENTSTHGPRRLGVLNAHVLDLRVTGQRVQSLFPSVPALLVPAKR